MVSTSTVTYDADKTGLLLEILVISTDNVKTRRLAFGQLILPKNDYSIHVSSIDAGRSHFNMTVPLNERLVQGVHQNERHKIAFRRGLYTWSLLLLPSEAIVSSLCSSIYNNAYVKATNTMLLISRVYRPHSSLYC